MAIWGRDDAHLLRGAPNKLLGLELLRFISALAVLIWHYQHFYLIDGSRLGFQRDAQPLYGLLFPFYEKGLYGVQVFWCISGFIFFWKYADLVDRRVVGPRQFFWLRFSRLYPLHLATLLLIVTLQGVFLQNNGHYFVYASNDPFHFVMQLFLASNWGWESGLSFNGPIWSVSVEILVYLLFFAVLRLLGSALLLNVSIVALCVAAKLAGMSSPIIDCVACFYMGGTAALVHARLRHVMLRRLVLISAWLVVVLLPLASYLSGAYQHGEFASVFLIVYVPALLYVMASDLRLGRGAESAITTLGSMTYASYLIHFPIQLLLATALTYFGLNLPVGSTAFFLAFIGGTLVASVFVYRYFEMPMQDALRRRLLGARPERVWAEGQPA